MKILYVCRSAYLHTVAYLLWFHNVIFSIIGIQLLGCIRCRLLISRLLLCSIRSFVPAILFTPNKYGYNIYVNTSVPIVLVLALTFVKFKMSQPNHSPRQVPRNLNHGGNASDSYLEEAKFESHLAHRQSWLN